MPLPTDPIFSQQWHLRNTTAGLLDLNVTSVWNPTQGPGYTGAGIRVAVIDDGFDYNHSDLDNYNTVVDYDFRDNDSDPFGLPGDSHGTAVTGLIGAERDGTGAVGVAYGSELVGLRTEGLINDYWLQDIRDAIQYAAITIGSDVINISQGIANDTYSEFGFGYDAARFDEIETSIINAVISGRGGLGTIIVKSAGNSRGDDYDVNADDWTNDTRQVVVAAVDQDGFISSYSSYGSAVLVSGFGTPGEVVTTDRVGADGYDATDFTTTFNGTSSAAPMVSGVVSLVLDANGGLGWRDVQSILSYSARHVGSAVGAGTAGSERYAWQWNGANNWNGGGLHFSNDYGYGLVNALAAVRLAETWLLFPGDEAEAFGNEFEASVDMLAATVTIPDGNATGTTFTGNISYHDAVERVTLTVSFATTYVGDVQIYVTSPSGTVSQLLDNVDSSNAFNGTWTFESQAFRGEDAAGTWQVRIVDNAALDTLTVSDIVLETYGEADLDVDERYVFTDEYSDYAGVAGHLTSVTDSNGGSHDSVNAAAVTTGSRIFLNGVAGLIDGVAVTFTNIEHAVGGDGNDVLVGNSGANHLHGGRGNDSINGGLGIDTMVGGFGDDTYAIDSASDIVTEFNDYVGGRDTIIANFSFSLAAIASVERLNLTGAAGDAQATGNSLNNVISTGAGNDLINGGLGNDLMIGGGGNDTYYVTELFDFVQEFAGGGFDRTISWVSFRLQNNVERLDLFGTDNIYGIGNNQANVIIGNTGNNSINGLGGNDTLTGGLGIDSFGFNSAIGASNLDTVTDFSHADDTVILENAVFTGLATGQLSAAQFHSGSIATAQADDRITYDSSNGWVYFDTNGAAAGGWQQFVNLGIGNTVTNTDFYVV